MHTEPCRPTTAEGALINERHERKVAQVAGQLRRRTGTMPLSRHKRAVSHQVPKVHDRKYTDEKVDLLDLDRVIEIDPVRRICIAEPGVTFCRLVDMTLPPALVPISSSHSLRRPAADAPAGARTHHRPRTQDHHDRRGGGRLLDRIDVVQTMSYN